MSKKSLGLGCLIWLILAAVVAGGLVYLYIENEAKKERAAAAKEATYQQLVSTILDTAEKFKADTSCNDELFFKADGATFHDKIMTVDVQKCWLQNRPILFRGALTDVAQLDNDNYTIFVESNMPGGSKKLRLILKCKKDIMDGYRILVKKSQLSKKDWEKDFDKDGVAVIANVLKVSSSGLDDNKNTTDAKIGYGDCLALELDEGKLKRLMRSLGAK